MKKNNNEGKTKKVKIMKKEMKKNENNEGENKK